MEIDLEKEEIASKLRGSFREFLKFFVKYITNRDYIESNPVGRESHQITIARELVSFARMEHPEENLMINVEPGSGKSMHICMWVAWCYAHNPQCNFIYISYSAELAAEQTAFIKQIMSSPQYGYLFDVHIAKDTKAKDHFATTKGGHIAAFGAAGGITGRNAGLPNTSIFSGAVIIDDAHKPDEVYSDTKRDKVIKNYVDTIRQRPRGSNVPIIFIGQRVHEDDLAAFFLEGKDIKQWRKVILLSLDEAGNALYPEVHNKEYLESLREKSPYVFFSQFQQQPNPAGGSLFEPRWFLELEQEPNFLLTFVTADTAETSKTHNDPCAFSFLGLYEIEIFGRKTGDLGLHIIDVLEDWIEAKDLQDRFMEFWFECSRHKTPPFVAAIEKKSTGVTLCGTLDNIQGIKIREVKRTKADGSKAVRYIEMQPYAASKRLTLTRGARHVEMFKRHMGKIAANNAHRHDDICFIAGTKIATLFGDKNIQDITTNDRIITPFGICKVIAAGKTQDSSVISRIGLTGTTNHPIFYENNFLPLDTIYDDDKIDKLSLRGLLRWRYLRLLNSMVLNIGLRGREGIISANQIPMLEGEIRKDCILQFMNFIREKKFAKAISFIIKTIILTIMTLTIWSVYRGASTLKSMRRFAASVLTPKKNCNTWKILGRRLLNGIKVMQDALGIAQMQKLLPLKYSMNVPSSVNTADQILWLENQNLGHVPMLVEPENTESAKKPVYNLTVQTDGVYYANGILVSNCDTIYDGVKIALIDKSLYGLTALKEKSSGDDVMNSIAQMMNRQQRARANRDGIR